ncbi:MAG: hypothetical protein GY866_14850 [Proteobacteria bacterium]|nr:hypothetical protein [Pseudomonadota bacterium]
MSIKDPIERKRIFVLNVTLLAIFAALVLGGYWFQGLDFAKATLIGCIVVAINFFVSQRLISRLILEKTININLLVVYVFKLGISIAILFVAVTRLQMDPVGLMLGLSSIVFATVISTLLKRDPVEEDD